MALIQELIQPKRGDQDCKHTGIYQAIINEFRKKEIIVKFVCFGDSLAFGYQVSYEEKWHVIAEKKTGIQMKNCGISGDTTDGMLTRIQKQVFDANPDGVILMGGYNDIFFNRSWDRAAQNIKAMVDQSRDRNLRVFVAIPPPILLPVAFKEGGDAVDFEKSSLMIEAYCHWLRDFTAAAQIPELDFRATIDWTDKNLYLDGIHQSPAGHQKMADRVIKFLEKQSGPQFSRVPELTPHPLAQ